MKQLKEGIAIVQLNPPNHQQGRRGLGVLNDRTLKGYKSRACKTMIITLALITLQLQEGMKTEGTDVMVLSFDVRHVR